jgi:hypothetical protein
MCSFTAGQSRARGTRACKRTRGWSSTSPKVRRAHRLRTSGPWPRRFLWPPGYRCGDGSPSGLSVAPRVYWESHVLGGA